MAKGYLKSKLGVFTDQCFLTMVIMMENFHKVAFFVTPQSVEIKANISNTKNALDSIENSIAMPS